MSQPATAAPDPLEPGDARLFVNRYARWGRRWALVAAVSIGGGVWAFAVHGLIFGMILATLLGTVGFIFGLSFWLVGRGQQAELDALRGGGHLARWPIERDRWMAWHAERVAAHRFAAFAVGGMMLLAGLVVSALVYGDGEWIDAAWIAAIAVFGAPVIGVVIIAHGPTPPAPSARTVPLVIGMHGAVTEGAGFSWKGLGLAFAGAEVQASPPTLVVRLLISGKHGRTEKPLNLPVPPDRLAEARRVVEILRQNHPIIDELD